MANTGSSQKKKSASAAKKAAPKGAPTKSRKAASKAAPKAAPAPEPRQAVPTMWIYAGILMLIAVLALVGFFLDPKGEDGFVIRYLRMGLMGILGYGYWIFPFALGILSWILVSSNRESVVFRGVCAALLPFLLGSALHLILCKSAFTQGDVYTIIKELYTGGVAGETGGVLAGGLGMLLQAALSKYAAAPLLLLAFLYALLRCFHVTVQKIFQWLQERSDAKYYPEELDDEDDPFFELEQADLQPVRRKTARTARPQPKPVRQREVHQTEPSERKEAPAKARLRPAKVTYDINMDDEPVRPKTPAVKDTSKVKPLSVEEAAGLAGVELADPKQNEAGSTTGKGAKKAAAAAVEAETAAITAAIENEADLAAYQYPPVTILQPGTRSKADASEEVSFNRDRLETALQSFGVNASIRDITRGPTVTRYDLELEAGVKLNKITNLSGDLALALGVENVRIAPVPDKISTVGIEVPNKVISMVRLRDIIDTDTFRNAKSKVSFAVGKDIAGNNIVGNISKLPHMLIAGTTGSGKSVFMNSLILSLLYKATPEEVRLIMIDPKMVEFGVYNGIPHLYIPVVTDPKKAAGALQWAVVEMLKRYRLFSEVQVRDITSYNELQRATADGETLPNVVVVIDELADLMLCAAKEVEESICRVAQMGRAAGMHLIIATQRPSSDVITGLMKANIPSRVALSVSSALDSRIILDTMGAEKLIGNGDMLYAPITLGKPLRVQGAFVSDEERDEVIQFIKQNSDAQYSDDIIAQIEQAAIKEDSKSGGSSGGDSASSGGKDNDHDELLPQAVDVILETNQASVSLLQRRLKLGYSRAARLVDQMEEIGVVGPFQGSKPRDILITKQQWQEMQYVQGTAPGEVLQTQMAFADDSEDTFQDEA